MGPIVHIHVGPGKLGLGLLVWSGVKAGFEVHVVARPGSIVDDATALEIVVRSQDGTDQDAVRLPVASVCHAHEPADISLDLRRVLGAARDVLITTSVTTRGIPAITPLLVELAVTRERVEGGTTTFIAGENDPGETYDILVAELGRSGVDCRRTMVNRICFEPAALGRDGARVVRADCLAEWLVEGPPDSPALAALDELAHVTFVEDVEPYEIRKRWLVNGGHVALAILARANNHEQLDVEASEPGRSAWLRRLQAILIDALEVRFPQLEGNAEYGLAHVAAWMRHDDSASRVLSRLTRANIGPLLADLDRKLGEPLRAARLVDDERWTVVEDLLEVLHRVLRSFEL